MKNLLTLEKFNINKELVDYLDENYIEEYYNTHYDISILDICDIYPNIILRNIDDKSFLNDYIESEIDNSSIEDISTINELKDFINYNLTEEKEEKILEFWKEIHENDYDEDELSEIEFDIKMLDDLEEDQLIDIIKDDDDEDKYIETVINSRYEGRDAEDILGDMYNIHSDFKRIFPTIRDYIDEDDIIEQYKKDESFEYKRDFVINSIEQSKELQLKILKSNKESVILLYDLFIGYSSDNNISNTYRFQKNYIKQYVIENKGSEEDDILIAIALSNLNENFTLNDKIKEKYKKYIWLSDSNEFNI